MDDYSNTLFSNTLITLKRLFMARSGKQSSQVGTFSISTLQVVTLKLTDDNYHYCCAQTLCAVGVRGLV